MKVSVLRPLLLLAAGSSCVHAFTTPAAALRLSTGPAAVLGRRVAGGVQMMALPAGWQQVKDPESGDFYYYNKQTGVTQWEAPAAASPAKPAATATKTSNKVTGFDVKEFERTGRIVQLEGGAAEPSFVNPVIKLASAGMGLIKPIFAAEATLQAAALGGIAKVTTDDVVAEIEADKAANPCVIYTYKLSPFSTEALALLDKSGYEYTNIELGLEWFALGGRGSQTRVALAGMCENGATSLPKIFIGGKSIGGASGFSALADVVEAGELEALMKAAGAAKK